MRSQIDVEYPARAVWTAHYYEQPSTGRWKGCWSVYWEASTQYAWDGTPRDPAGAHWREDQFGKSREVVERLLAWDKTVYETAVKERKANEKAAQDAQIRNRWVEVK